MKEWLTVPEVEGKTGIPNNTIRRYIRNHGEFIRHKKEGKAYVIANESIDIVKHIRELYEQNLTIQIVNEKLENSSLQKTITIDEKQMFMTMAEKIQQLEQHVLKQNEEIRELKANTNKQDGFNQALIERLDKQEERQKQRDEQMNSFFNEWRESQKQIATAEERTEKKGFWARIFGR